MRSILFIPGLLFFFSANTHAQELSGRWYSSDSSRVYEIRLTGDKQWQAVIVSSSRKNDKPGTIVLKDIVYNADKKRLEGAIYADEGSKPVFTKIKFSKDDPDKLELKLTRMFLFDVTINWYRMKKEALTKIDIARITLMMSEV